MTPIAGTEAQWAMIRLRRSSGPVPFVRYYDVELAPPDSREPWRPEKPVSAFALKRRLFAEAYYQRDVADLVLEADGAWNQGARGEWLKHADVRLSR